MITLSPATFSPGTVLAARLEQDHGSSNRWGKEGNRQSRDLFYDQERLSPSPSVSQGEENGLVLPKLSDALKNLYDGRLRTDMTFASGGNRVMKNSNLIAKRVLHFTSKQ